MFLTQEKIDQLIYGETFMNSAGLSYTLHPMGRELGKKDFFQKEIHTFFQQHVQLGEPTCQKQNGKKLLIYNKFVEFLNKELKIIQKLLVQESKLIGSIQITTRTLKYQTF